MARIRTVKPSLFGSYTLSRVPVEARYLFIGLFCEADDEGRLIDSPKRLAGSLFPHDDKVTPAKVNAWLDKLQEENCVLRYAHGSDRYLMLPKWPTHQRISNSTPSLLPPPTTDLLEVIRSGCGKNREPFRPEEEEGTGNRDIPLTPFISPAPVDTGDNQKWSFG